jgi:hypothetical protein
MKQPVSRRRHHRPQLLRANTIFIDESQDQAHLQSNKQKVDARRTLQSAPHLHSPDFWNSKHGLAFGPPFVVVEAAAAAGAAAGAVVAGAALMFCS